MEKFPKGSTKCIFLDLVERSTSIGTSSNDMGNKIKSPIGKKSKDTSLTINKSKYPSGMNIKATSGTRNKSKYPNYTGNKRKCLRSHKGKI